MDSKELAQGLRKARNTLSKDCDAILQSIPQLNRIEAEKELQELSSILSKWEGLDTQAVSATQIFDLQNDALNISGQLQSLLVAGPAHAIPDEYKDLPQLHGCAVAEIIVADKSKPGQVFTVTFVLDGLNAPITTGNFVDLVQKGFYNGMPIQRADGFVAQTGEAPSAAARRKIPMEVRYAGEEDITYGLTKEELGLRRKEVVLPFNAQGTLAMARSEFEANSANTQFFLLNKESEVTPSGANVLDGNYAVFGYCVEGQDAVEQLDQGDVIKSDQMADYSRRSAAPS